MAKTELIKAYEAIDIAKFFLSITDEDSGELVSNLKLQKLLYYAQGIHVALHGKNAPLFHDKIYAWKHGPVVKEVYKKFAKYTNGAIPPQSAPEFDKEETKLFLIKVYNTFGRYSAWALRDMTHKEDPWIDNYKPDVKDIEIPLKDLEKFFRKQVA